MKYYVGIVKAEHYTSGTVKIRGCREVFQSSFKPTKETHGHLYAAVIGPFNTKRGAKFMAKHGANNPHLQTVADAEQAAKKERN